MIGTDVNVVRCDSRGNRERPDPIALRQLVAVHEVGLRAADPGDERPIADNLRVTRRLWT